MYINEYSADTYFISPALRARENCIRTGKGPSVSRRSLGIRANNITSPHLVSIDKTHIIERSFELFNCHATELHAPTGDSFSISMLVRRTPTFLKLPLTPSRNISPAVSHLNRITLSYLAQARLHQTANMLHPSTEPSKRIFAPTSNSTDPGHATQYTKGALNFEDLLPSPTDQFHKWFQEAQEQKVYQPETVTFSTAELPSGKVSARMVYMKELDAKGFVIYSNWDTSRKGSDVRSNPHAALTFWWHELERQVRVEGRVERLKSEESQVYYDTRIRGSRIGAWASQQSKVLESREELEKRVEEVEKRFSGKDEIPVPEFWGGLRLIPEVVEFWQGRPSRLHDRFKYTKGEGEEWKVERLSP